MAVGQEQAGQQAAHTHDYGHALHAIETDLEYFRTKRLEPRIMQVLRRGALCFRDLMAAYEPQPAAPQPADQEARLRLLQDRLDAYITGIATLNVPLRSVDLVVDDGRRERGDYDEFFRIKKRRHEGTIEERFDRLAAELDEAHEVLGTFTRALLGAGEVSEAQLAERRQWLAGLGYRNGARIVARAWTDPEFKTRLLESGRKALRDLDVPSGRLGRLGVAEDTAEVHNVVVCTLCSCYPHDLLGDPPWWYRSDEYKQRIVADPRAALGEMFDLHIDPNRVVRVHDSTSDLRWMVLPRRPEGTEGWDEERLAELVSSESLVGVAEIPPPGGADQGRG